MPVSRVAIDLGFGVATIHANHSPAEAEAHGLIVLTLIMPATDDKPANSMDFWNHEGLVNLRDALSRAIEEREQELEEEVEKARREARERVTDLQEAPQSNEPKSSSNWGTGLTRL